MEMWAARKAAAAGQTDGQLLQDHAVQSKDPNHSASAPSLLASSHSSSARSSKSSVRSKLSKSGELVATKIKGCFPFESYEAPYSATTGMHKMLQTEYKFLCEPPTAAVFKHEKSPPRRRRSGRLTFDDCVALAQTAPFCDLTSANGMSSTVIHPHHGDLTCAGRVRQIKHY